MLTAYLLSKTPGQVRALMMFLSERTLPSTCVMSNLKDSSGCRDEYFKDNRGFVDKPSSIIRNLRNLTHRRDYILVFLTYETDIHINVCRTSKEQPRMQNWTPPLHASPSTARQIAETLPFACRLKRTAEFSREIENLAHTLTRVNAGIGNDISCLKIVDL